MPRSLPQGKETFAHLRQGGIVNPIRSQSLINPQLDGPHAAVRQTEMEDSMRFLLVCLLVLAWCAQAEARTKWVQSAGAPCETVCRHPVTVGGRPDAYVCAGHVTGAPYGEIRSGMIGAGSTNCYVPGEQGRMHSDGPFVCLCDPR